MGRVVGRDVTRCACKKKRRGAAGGGGGLFVLNGRVKDGWRGPRNWKGEEIR